MGMKIEIEVMSSGGIYCNAYMTGGDNLDSNSCTQAVGALEIAKMSILAGRWGVTDAKATKRNFKKVRGYKLDDVIGSYIKKRMEQESSANTGDKP